MELIPRIIHLIVRDKQRLRADAPLFWQKVSSHHPEWHFMLYDDEDAENFVRTQYPEWLAAYLLFSRNIQRVDVFRLIVLYHYGGFYMDTDMLVQRSLDDLLIYPVVLAEEKTLTQEECLLHRNRDALRIANYVLGSVAAAPFLLHLINTALHNASLPVHNDNDVLETTGPGLLSTFYHDHKETYDNIHLVLNNKNYCIKGCSRQPSCHFGDYATHLHLGSWRRYA